MPRIRTLTALVATLMVLVLPPSAAGADAHVQPAAEAAAEWIAAELEAAEPSFDLFGAVGSRADVMFALAAAGTQADAFDSAYEDLLVGTSDYVGSEGTINAAAAGKVLLAAAIAGDGADEIVAGRDLAMEVLERMGVDGAFPDDFSGPNVFTQSLAVLGLATTPGGVPEEASVWLAERQCADGAFQFDGTCPVLPGGEDPDSTGLAALALLAAGLEVEAGLATGWLASNQAPDGSIASGQGANANSTAIAAQALRATGRNAAADDAAEFLLTLQLADGPDAGAFRWLPGDPESNGFATLQVVPGLVAGSFLELEAPEPMGVEFADVPSDHPFGEEIAWLGGAGITRGCNPPVNDRFCPDNPVTRGQMAAFLHRAFDDMVGTPVEPFVDAAGSVFVSDIEWLAGVGITRGCNPPVNDRFCPDDPVTRGQMAAFLHRAFDDMVGTPVEPFVDAAGSVFVSDIEWLAGVGITRGCNPPVNDRFCPDDPVTRGQMAAFLYRSRGF